MGARYPGAEWVPWAYNPAAPSYYQGQNDPQAGVLHIASGWKSTIRTWAQAGYNGASWTFTVNRDGSVWQHLELEDGGYQAGIARYRESGRENPPPTWRGWRGWGQNVNHYTVGVEHEGMSGEPFTPAQAAASKALCKWIAATCGFPFDRDHFPPHADIAILDRPIDFNSPPLREEFYRYLFSPIVLPPPQPVPVPPEPPIQANAEQLRIIQEALGKPAYMLPDRNLLGFIDYPVGAAFGREPGFIAKGALIARYYLGVAVNPEDWRPR